MITVDFHLRRDRPPGPWAIQGTRGEVRANPDLGTRLAELLREPPFVRDGNHYFNKIVAYLMGRFPCTSYKLCCWDYETGSTFEGNAWLHEHVAPEEAALDENPCWDCANEPEKYLFKDVVVQDRSALPLCGSYLCKGDEQVSPGWRYAGGGDWKYSLFRTSVDPCPKFQRRYLPTRFERIVDDSL
jgi:hypothetical protein